MGKKNNIIEINGKRYDAHTGAAIGHAPVTVKPASKPIAVHHHTDTPAVKEPTVHHSTTTTRKTAKKLPSHAPQRSTTLMRKAVKKPSPSLKRHVKAIGHTSSLVDQPDAPVVPKLSFGNPDPKRLQHASHIKKSRLISHFNFNQSQPAYAVPVTVVTPSKPVFTPKAPKRRLAPDASDIFERAVQQATSHLEPAYKTHKKRRLYLVRKHTKHARA